MGLVIMRVLQKLCVELLRTFDDFSSFLSSAATTPHEFITTGDFNIQLDATLCALDVAKAFDKTNHFGLYVKLMDRHIPLPFLVL